MRGIRQLHKLAKTSVYGEDDITRYSNNAA